MWAGDVASCNLKSVWVSAVLLAMAAPSGLAYDLEPSTSAHNHACVEWSSAAGHRDDADQAIEVAPGLRLCRTHQGELGGEHNGACRGEKEYEVAARPEEANVFWHRQNFNALPLPLMTWLGAARPGVTPKGICRVTASDGIANESWIGVLHGAGKDYAKCQRYNGDLIEGNFDLLGAYNRSAPYLPVRQHLRAALCQSAYSCVMHRPGARILWRSAAAQCQPRTYPGAARPPHYGRRQSNFRKDYGHAAARAARFLDDRSRRDGRSVPLGRPLGAL